MTGWSSRLLACAALLVAAPLSAQSDRYAPVVLQLPATPRAAVLGAGPGMRDIETLFSNPARVGISAGTVAGVARYEAGTLVSMASATSLGAFSVGIGAQYLDANADIPRLPFWSYSLRHGGAVTVGSAVGAFALATTFRGWRVGAAAKYLDERHGGFQDATASLEHQNSHLVLTSDQAQSGTGLLRAVHAASKMMLAPKPPAAQAVHKANCFPRRLSSFSA
jgi:hypothetical protein